MEDCRGMKKKEKFDGLVISSHKMSPLWMLVTRPAGRRIRRLFSITSLWFKYYFAAAAFFCSNCSKKEQVVLRGSVITLSEWVSDASSMSV